MCGLIMDEEIEKSMAIIIRPPDMCITSDGCLKNTIINEINDTRTLARDMRDISLIIEKYLKICGILGAKHFSKFDKILENLQRVRDFKFSDLFKERLLNNITVIKTLDCDEIIDDKVVMFKKLYYLSDTIVCCKYYVWDGFYLVEGTFENGKPEGYCMESFQNSDVIYDKTERHGKFTDGIKQGEFVVFSTKYVYLLGESAPNKSFVYENYVDGILSEQRVEIYLDGDDKVTKCRVSNGYCSKMYRTDYDEHGGKSYHRVDDSNYSSISIDSNNETHLKLSNTNNTVQYNFKYDGGNFYIVSIILENIDAYYHSVLTYNIFNHIISEQRFFYDVMSQKVWNKNNHIHQLNCHLNINNIPSDTFFHFT